MEIKKEIPPTALPRCVFLCWSCVSLRGRGKDSGLGVTFSAKTLVKVCPAPRPEFSELTFRSFTALFMDHNESFRLPSYNSVP